MADEASWPIPWQAVEGNRGGALAWAEYAAARSALATVAALPLSAQDAFAGALARAARRLDQRHTKSAREFIEQAMGRDLTHERREEMVLGAWRYFFTLILRNARFDERVPLESLLSHCDVDLCDDARKVAASGRGALLVTGHIGDFEVAAPVAKLLGFGPLYVVSRPPKNRPLSIAAQRARERRGYRLIPRRGAMQSIPRIVEAGGMVAMLLDQRARKRTVIAPFFGRPAHCERAIGVLMRRLRVPVVMACCYTTAEPFRYRFVMPSVLWPDELAHASPEAIATRINSELERMILAHPEQYFWLHDRYAKAPASLDKDDDDD